MNDIKLSRWDRVRLDRETLRNLTIANGHTDTSLVYSKSDIVCLTKTIASRMIAEMSA
jgi:hypothetical protein